MDRVHRSGFSQIGRVERSSVAAEVGRQANEQAWLDEQNDKISFADHAEWPLVKTECPVCLDDRRCGCYVMSDALAIELGRVSMHGNDYLLCTGMDGQCKPICRECATRFRAKALRDDVPIKCWQCQKHGEFFFDALAGSMQPALPNRV